MAASWYWASHRLELMHLVDDESGKVAERAGGEIRIDLLRLPVVVVFVSLPLRFDVAGLEAD
jgi:hypothetical protein